MIKKYISTQSLLWLALLLALYGSLRHVAWGFSTLENGDMLAGYIQAVAVDLGLLGMAIGIQAARTAGRDTVARWLWGGAAFFAGVSVYANLLHGLAFESAIKFQRDWGQFGLIMIALRPFLLSGVLPLMVIYLSEIVGANREWQKMSDIVAQPGVTLDIPAPMLANIFLDNWRQQYGREPIVPEFVHHFASKTGQRVSDEAADQYILEWRSANGISGARPRKPVVEFRRNGNG